jgi:hypothetical protein
MELKKPHTYKSPVVGCTATSAIEWLVLLLRLLQVEPFHLATLDADTPPTLVKLPTTYRLPELSKAAEYIVPAAPPRLAQEDPSNFMMFPDTPANSVKAPTAYMSPVEGCLTNLYTVPLATTATHSVPFHLAILAVARPPTVLKFPPMKKEAIKTPAAYAVYFV